MAQDVIVPLAKQLIAGGEKIIVFRNKRGKAQGCAAYLANALGLPPAAEILTSLPTRDNTTATTKLRECLNGGTSLYKNMARRAGRLGIRDRGRSIIYAETSLERQQLFARYVKGTFA